jgi:hypothetical protein
MRRAWDILTTVMIVVGLGIAANMVRLNMAPPPAAPQPKCIIDQKDCRCMKYAYRLTPSATATSPGFDLVNIP